MVRCSFTKCRRWKVFNSQRPGWSRYWFRRLWLSWLCTVYSSMHSNPIFPHQSKWRTFKFKAVAKNETRLKETVDGGKLSGNKLAPPLSPLDRLLNNRCDYDTNVGFVRVPENAYTNDGARVFVVVVVNRFWTKACEVVKSAGNNTSIYKTMDSLCHLIMVSNEVPVF